MSRSISLLLAGMFVAPAGAQDATGGNGKLTDPVEILRKADAAMKAVQTVRYLAVHEDFRTVKPELPAVKGTVVLSGWTGRSATKWFVDVMVKYPDSGNVENLLAGSDGETFFLVDKAAKKAYESKKLDVAGSRRRNVELLIVNEFVHSKPLTDEIDGETFEFLGVTKVEDQDCYVVHVKYKGTNQETRWFFSTKDLLPRRVDRYFTGVKSGRGYRRLTLSSLEVDPKLPDSTFKMVLPEGFTRIEGKAP